MDLKITEKDVASQWDKNAEIWKEQVRKGFDIYREKLNNPAFFNFIGDVKGKKILDAACGEGYNTRKVAQLGAILTGVDISKKFINHCTV